MKALSLRQPWANAVLYLGKHIENRRWWTSFRGEFLIHASKTLTEEEIEAAIDTADDALGVSHWPMVEMAFGRGDHPQKKTLHLGGIVGRARLVDVVCPRPSGRLPFDENVAGIEAHYPESVRRTPDLWRWHMQEQYGFVLEDVCEVPFVACRGMPGFFDVPEEVIDELVVRGIEEMAAAIAERGAA